MAIVVERSSRSTGADPSPRTPTPPDRAADASPLAAYLDGVYRRHRVAMDGAVATYIPELGDADPAWFGVALATLDGRTHAVGDADHRFTIQSISKPLTYAFLLDELGEAAVRARIGVEPTGDAFNAITLAPASGTPLNPMVNAGAIAAAGLVPSRDGVDAGARIVAAIERFVGHPLEIDQAVLESERATGHRNRAIGHLLRASGVLEVDAAEAVDRYFVQCSISVTARDLAVVAATLANGGVNPITGQRAASASAVRTVLSVLATCGMYDGAGEWLVSVGLPAKSGVAGGILAVAPGRLGIASFSPPLDAQGNSVRGTRVCRDLVRDLRLHPLAPHDTPTPPIHATYCLAEVGSRRRRSTAEREVLARAGRAIRVIELHGALGFLAADSIADALAPAHGEAPIDLALLDLQRVERIEPPAIELLATLVAASESRGTSIVVTGGGRQPAAIAAIDRALGTTSRGTLRTMDTLDAALEAAEDLLLEAAGAPVPGPVGLAEQSLVRALDADDLAAVAAVVGRRTYPAGTRILRVGDPAAELLLVERGRCSVVVDLEGGGQRRLSTLGPGMSFGETALVGGGRRGADVVADSDVVCYVLTTEAFEALGRERPTATTGILRALLGSAVETAGRLTGELAVLASA